MNGAQIRRKIYEKAVALGWNSNGHPEDEKNNKLFWDAEDLVFPECTDAEIEAYNLYVMRICQAI